VGSLICIVTERRRAGMAMHAGFVLRSSRNRLTARAFVSLEASTAQNERPGEGGSASSPRVHPDARRGSLCRTRRSRRSGASRAAAASAPVGPRAPRANRRARENGFVAFKTRQWPWRITARATT
jgi:hypothetical protein